MEKVSGDSFNVQRKHTFNVKIGFHFIQKPQVEHNQLFWKVVWVTITQSPWQHEVRPLFQWPHLAFLMAACGLLVPSTV